MKHNGLIISLDGITDSDQPIVGAKATGLSRLKRLGLPVPDAFCVAANAYETHINSPSLKAVIDDVLVFSSKPEGFDITNPMADVQGYH